MRLFQTILSFIALSAASSKKHYHNKNYNVENGCVTFYVGSGTGCAWMCNYCANALGTNNYYFVDGVCAYGDSGCVGNPVAGNKYTCCAV